MGRLPPAAKGALRECVYCGFWYPERDRRIIKRKDKFYCKWCFDDLFDDERREQFQRVLNKGGKA